ncbi:MAG: hypothetical protein OXM57_01090 [bacterium]|nr:hypothetical protein [bacterium]MDE0351274.1 hypothetical protein [bacterium]
MDSQSGTQGQVAPASNGMAIAGLVLAICAVALSWLPVVNFACWVLGLIFSIMGLRNANRGAPYRGLAIAGLVISLAGIVLIVVLIIVVGLVAVAA